VRCIGRKKEFLSFGTVAFFGMPEIVSFSLLPEATETQGEQVNEQDELK